MADSSTSGRSLLGLEIMSEVSPPNVAPDRPQRTPNPGLLSRLAESSNPTNPTKPEMSPSAGDVPMQKSVATAVAAARIPTLVDTINSLCAIQLEELASLL